MVQKFPTSEMMMATTRIPPRTWKSAGLRVATEGIGVGVGPVAVVNTVVAVLAAIDMAILEYSR